MKKVFLSIFALTAITVSSFAQQGSFQLSPAVELALPTGDAADNSKPGIGVTVKGLYGISEAGQITLTSGLLVSGAKKDIKEMLGADKITSTMIPILAGYRHNFNGIYVEPQVGYGIYGAKIKGGEFESKESDGAFTWAAGAGYIFNNFEAGIRYQSSHKDGSNSGFFGVRLGYILPIGNK